MSWARPTLASPTSSVPFSPLGGWNHTVDWPVEHSIRAMPCHLGCWQPASTGTGDVNNRDANKDDEGTLRDGTVGQYNFRPLPADQGITWRRAQ